MIIRKDTSWLARTLPSLCDVPLTTKAGRAQDLSHLRQAQAGLLFLRHRCLSLPSTAFAQRWKWPMKHHPVRQDSEFQVYFSDVGALWSEKTDHTATVTFNNRWLTVSYDWHRYLMGKIESRWMLTVNGQGAIPSAQHTAPGIQQPRTTARPISQPRFFRSTPSGPIHPPHVAF